MLHPATELRFIGPETGCGVVATRPIPAGTIIWVRDGLDREFTPEEVARLDPLAQDVLSTYSFRNQAGRYVLCWDHGRFINHSFRANCLPTAYGFELAVRDIEPGEELTDDYGALNIIEPFRARDEGTRRKTVYPDDLLRYHALWDRKLLRAFRRIDRVEQPLKALLDADRWNTCLGIAAGALPMQSIRTLYCR